VNRTPYRRLGSRRGLANETIIILIILILTLVGIAVIFLNSTRLLSDETRMKICAASIVVQQQTNERWFTLFMDSPFSTACGRRFLTIDRTETTARSSGSLRGEAAIPVRQVGSTGRLIPAESYRAVTGDIVASVAADSLRRCWDVGGNGKQDVFVDEGLWFERSTVCMVCDEIVVASPLADPPTATWLTDWLTTRQVPGTQTRSTYAEYLYFSATKDAGSGGPIVAPYNTLVSGGNSARMTQQLDCLARIGIDPNPQLRSGTAYATIFVRSFGFGRESCMAPAIVPVTRVRTLCEFVAN
jgi:hypothetical protein